MLPSSALHLNTGYKARRAKEADPDPVWRKCTIPTLLTLCLLLCAVRSLRAQLNRGVIEGIVTDAQGAVVPGAQVTVISAGTGVRTIARTNGAGYYRAQDLVPGTFRVQVVASGFRSFDETGIEVIAGGVHRIDARLKVGATHQVVQVSAAPTQIETSPTNASTTLDSQTVENIPLDGRDLQQLVFLIPGVNSVAGPPGTNFGFNSGYGTFPDPTHVFGSDVSVNGGQGGANAWYLDGNLNLSPLADNVVVNPSPDAVQEFQAVTNAFSAEYSRTGGGVFSVVLKSGTNQVHGDLYEFVRNSATNARNPFTSIGFAGQLLQNSVHFNNFGGTVGGPVVIPHIYNGRNKTFFFFSDDVNNLHYLKDGVFTVPTPAMRAGDFSEDPSTAQYGIWDPNSTVGPNSQGLYDRTAFGTPIPGNPYGASGCLASSVAAGAASGVNTCNFATQLPANRLDPTAMFFMKSFPNPNFNDPLSACPLANGGAYQICNNFLGPEGSTQDSQNFSLKIDHTRNDHNRFFFEGLYNPTHYGLNQVPWTGPTYPQSSVGASSTYPYDLLNQLWAFGNTYTFSPTLINQFRASFGRSFMTTHPDRPFPGNINGENQIEQVLKPLNIPIFQGPPLPNWQISTPSGGSINFGPTAFTSSSQPDEAYNFIDNITKVSGKHTFEGGVTYRLEHSAIDYVPPTQFSFGGGLVLNPQTGLGGGSGLAQFMLGAVANDGGTYSTVQAMPYNRTRYWGAFFQDDYHVTPRFTLNLGLRYDIFGWYKTRYPFDSGFCLGCINSLTGLLGQVVYSGEPGANAKGSDIFSPNWNDLGPRFNFAWTPFANQKTVIRGGYDIFYSDAADALNMPGQGGGGEQPGWANTTTWAGSFYPQCGGFFSGNCVVFPLSSTENKAALSTPPYNRDFQALHHASFIGQGSSGTQKPSHDPMIQSWNFEIQRELPSDTLVSVGYVGTHGTHLMGDMFHQYNFVPTADLLKYKTTLYSEVPVTQFYSGFTATALEKIYGPMATIDQLLSVYPAFPAGIGTTAQFDGTTIYHAMDLRVQKRFSNGLSFVAAYTVSKRIDNWATNGSVGAAMIVDPIGISTVGGRAAAIGSTLGGVCQNLADCNLDRAVAADDIPQIFNVAGSYQLPVGHGRRFLDRTGPLDAIFGGWGLSWTFNAQSGPPVSVSCPGNQLTSRCDLVGSAAFSGSRTKTQQIAQWINPAAFCPPYGCDQSFWANPNPTDPREWQFGTTGPRLSNFRWPGFWNLDASLQKQFHVTESKYFEFRWDAFNALNHMNLAASPNTGFCLPPLANGSTDTVHQAGCAFGEITNIQNDPRSMQFGLRFIW